MCDLGSCFQITRTIYLVQINLTLQQKQYSYTHWRDSSTINTNLFSDEEIAESKWIKVQYMHITIRCSIVRHRVHLSYEDFLAIDWWPAGQHARLSKSKVCNGHQTGDSLVLGRATIQAWRVDHVCASTGSRRLRVTRSFRFHKWYLISNKVRKTAAAWSHRLTVYG